MSYYVLKRLAFEAFLEEPWFGVGPGRFDQVADRAYEERRIHAPYRYADPHCTFLGRLAETGAPGGVSLVLLWAGFLSLRSDKREPSSWIDRAMVAASVGLLLNSVNADIMNFRFLWIGFGMMRATVLAPRAGARLPPTAP